MIVGPRGETPLGGDRARLVAQSAGYVLGGLAAVTPEMLSWPTPCEDWDLRALLVHVDDSIGALCEAMTRGTVGVGPGNGDWSLPAAQSSALALLAIAGKADDRQPVLVDGLPISLATVCEAGALELAVHGWDIAQTINGTRGRPRPLPTALASDLLDLAPTLITDADRPSRFAPPLAAPAGAGPADRLLAFSGRPASWAGKSWREGGV